VRGLADSLLCPLNSVLFATSSFGSWLSARFGSVHSAGVSSRLDLFSQQFVTPRLMEVCRMNQVNVVLWSIA